jgi:hypothetical protein
MTTYASHGWQLLEATLTQRCPERAADIRRLIEDLAARSGKRVELEDAARVGMAAGIMQVRL